MSEIEEPICSNCFLPDRAHPYQEGTFRCERLVPPVRPRRRDVATETLRILAEDAAGFNDLSPRAQRQIRHLQRGARA